MAGLFSGAGAAFQLPLPLARASNLRRHRSFLCRSCSGCFSRPSVNCPHGMLRGVSPSLNLAACPAAGGVRAGLFTLLTPSPRLAVRLPRPAHEPLPCTFSLGYTVYIYPEKSKAGFTHACKASVEVFRPRPLTKSAFVRQANCRFNADAQSQHHASDRPSGAPVNLSVSPLLLSIASARSIL